LKNGTGQEYYPDQFRWQIKVKSAAHLDSWVTDCFSGLNLEHRSDGTTNLQLRDNGVELLTLQVERVPE